MRSFAAVLLVVSVAGVARAQELSEAVAKAAEQAGAAAPREGPRFVWREHPSLRWGRDFRLDFQAKFQWDARQPGDDPHDFDTFEIHRMRVGIEGEVLRHFQFSLERELTENETNVEAGAPSKSAWKDVYLEVNYTDAAQVRFGKFKIPFGLDQLTGVANQDFVYRSLGGSYLAPARDVGGMVHGRFFDRGLNYWAGVFKQDGDNARSSKIQGGDETLAARVTGTPFRGIETAGLGRAEVGGAFTVSALSDESTLPNGLRGRTVMSQFVFFEPVFVKGRRQRFEADLDWETGPVGLRAEYTHVRDSREAQGLQSEDLPHARARAWYVSGGWVITGEDKRRPVEPRAGGLGRGGAGALEAVGRYERIWFDSEDAQPPAFRNPRARTIFPSGDRVLTLGVNWYVNAWVKLQLQTLREQLEDPERHPADGEVFWSQILRLQLGL